MKTLLKKKKTFFILPVNAEKELTDLFFFLAGIPVIKQEEDETEGDN